MNKNKYLVIFIIINHLSSNAVWGEERGVSCLSPRSWSMEGGYREHIGALANGIEGRPKSSHFGRYAGLDRTHLEGDRVKKLLGLEHRVISKGEPKIKRALGMIEERWGKKGLIYSHRLARSYRYGTVEFRVVNARKKNDLVNIPDSAGLTIWDEERSMWVVLLEDIIYSETTPDTALYVVLLDEIEHIMDKSLQEESFLESQVRATANQIRGLLTLKAQERDELRLWAERMKEEGAGADTRFDDFIRRAYDLIKDIPEVKDAELLEYFNPENKEKFEVVKPRISSFVLQDYVEPNIVYLERISSSDVLKELGRLNGDKDLRILRILRALGERYGITNWAEMITADIDGFISEVGKRAMPWALQERLSEFGYLSGSRFREVIDSLVSLIQRVGNIDFAGYNDTALASRSVELLSRFAQGDRRIEPEVQQEARRVLAELKRKFKGIGIFKDIHFEKIGTRKINPGIIVERQGKINSLVAEDYLVIADPETYEILYKVRRDKLRQNGLRNPIREQLEKIPRVSVYGMAYVKGKGLDKGHCLSFGHERRNIEGHDLHGEKTVVLLEKSRGGEIDIREIALLAEEDELKKRYGEDIDFSPVVYKEVYSITGDLQYTYNFKDEYKKMIDAPKIVVGLQADKNGKVKYDYHRRFQHCDVGRDNAGKKVVLKLERDSWYKEVNLLEDITDLEAGPHLPISVYNEQGEFLESYFGNFPTAVELARIAGGSNTLVVMGVKNKGGGRINFPSHESYSVSRDIPIGTDMVIIMKKGIDIKARKKRKTVERMYPVRIMRQIDYEIAKMEYEIKNNGETDSAESGQDSRRPQDVINGFMEEFQEKAMDESGQDVINRFINYVLTTETEEPLEMYNEFNKAIEIMAEGTRGHPNNYFLAKAVKRLIALEDELTARLRELRHEDSKLPVSYLSNNMNRAWSLLRAEQGLNPEDIQARLKKDGIKITAIELKCLYNVIGKTKKIVRYSHAYTQLFPQLKERIKGFFRDDLDSQQERDVALFIDSFIFMDFDTAENKLLGFRGMVKDRRFDRLMNIMRGFLDNSSDVIDILKDMVIAYLDPEEDGIRKDAVRALNRLGEIPGDNRSGLKKTLVIRAAEEILKHPRIGAEGNEYILSRCQELAADIRSVMDDEEGDDEEEPEDEIDESDATWIYSADGRRVAYWQREELEQKAHYYLEKAGKQGRIRRVWGHGSKGMQSGDDIIGLTEFIFSCADMAGLPKDEISIALVEPEENDEEIAGFSHLKESEGGNIKAVLTAVGGRFQYKGAEELIKKGKNPYTIYLRSDDVIIWKELGDEGKDAFIAKLRHEYKDAQRKLSGKPQAHYSEDKKVSDLINRQEENVLRIKRLLKNKLIDYLFHAWDYSPDYKTLEKFLVSEELPGRVGIFRREDERPDWIVLRNADRCVKGEPGIGVGELIKRSFGRDTGFRELILSNIEMAGSGSLFEKVAVTNVYILFRAVEILSKDKKFIKELHITVINDVMQSPAEDKKLLIVPKVKERKFLNKFDPGQVKENGIDPFLNWLGKKKDLLPRLRQLFPRSFDGYFEPFVGSGTVFFHCLPKGAVLNDANLELINIYTALRDEPERVIEYLEEYLRGYFFAPDGGPTTLEQKEDFYLCVRALPCYSRRQKPKKHDVLKDKYFPMPAARAHQAARMIFLNAVCKVGMSRFSPEGDFNVPFGNREYLGIAKTRIEIYAHPKGHICREEVLLEISSALNGVSIYSMDYAEVLRHARPGDFVYLDPPYDFEEHDAFTKYSRGQFKELEQWRLAKVFHELHKKGCYVMLSNNNTEFVRKLYEGFDVTVVKVERKTARVHSGKKEAEEVIIKNFINEGEGHIIRGPLEKQKDTMRVETRAFLPHVPAVSVIKKASFTYPICEASLADIIETEFVDSSIVINRDLVNTYCDITGQISRIVAHWLIDLNKINLCLDRFKDLTVQIVGGRFKYSVWRTDNAIYIGSELIEVFDRVSRTPGCQDFGLYEFYRILLHESKHNGRRTDMIEDEFIEELEAVEAEVLLFRDDDFSGYAFDADSESVRRILRKGWAVIDRRYSSFAQNTRIDDFNALVFGQEDVSIYDVAEMIVKNDGRFTRIRNEVIEICENRQLQIWRPQPLPKETIRDRIVRKASLSRLTEENKGKVIYEREIMGRDLKPGRNELQIKDKLLIKVGDDRYRKRRHSFKGKLSKRLHASILLLRNETGRRELCVTLLATWSEHAESTQKDVAGILELNHERFRPFKIVEIFIEDRYISPCGYRYTLELRREGKLFLCRDGEELIELAKNLNGQYVLDLTKITGNVFLDRFYKERGEEFVQRIGDVIEQTNLGRKLMSLISATRDTLVLARPSVRKDIVNALKASIVDSSQSELTQSLAWHVLGGIGADEEFKGKVIYSLDERACNKEQLRRIAENTRGRVLFYTGRDYVAPEYSFLEGSLFSEKARRVLIEDGELIVYMLNKQHREQLGVNDLALGRLAGNKVVIPLEERSNIEDDIFLGIEIIRNRGYTDQLPSIFKLLLAEKIKEYLEANGEVATKKRIQDILDLNIPTTNRYYGKGIEDSSRCINNLVTSA